jgi:glucosylglycerate phosphorylase
LRGLPGIYFHSLFGSRSWPAGVAQTGRYRTINRQKLTRADLEAALADPHSLRHRVFTAYRHLLQQRAGQPAFAPTAEQQVLFVDPALFCLLRRAENGRSPLLCLHNVTNQTQTVSLDLRPLELAVTNQWVDLVAGGRYGVKNGRELPLALQPYQVLWLQSVHNMV